jgi:hypothetical protein
LGYDAGHSPPSGGEIKNACNVFMFGMRCCHCRSGKNLIKQEAELTGGIYWGLLTLGNLIYGSISCSCGTVLVNEVLKRYVCVPQSV